MHDLLERRIEAHFPSFVRMHAFLYLLELFFQAVRNDKPVREQDHARIRAPPQDGLAVGKPGKNSMTIGIEQALRRQVSSRSEQAGSTVRIGQCR